jgi:serine protease AprX
MRRVLGRNEEIRASALWGKRSGSRGSALWGKGGRGFAAALSALIALALLVPGNAEAGKAKNGVRAFVTPPLLQAAKANPKRSFQVIVQGRADKDSDELADKIRGYFSRDPSISDEFDLISGVSLRLTGAQILKVASKSYISAITPDAPVELDSYSNKQKWAYVSGVARFWRDMERGLQPPAIAIVDSGVDKTHPSFLPGQVRHEVVLTQLANNSAGDGRGHGTFVAGIAAGAAPGYAGALPGAPIVSIDVMDNKGMAMTSDVIAAADWIYKNKDAHNIRVANFSLHSSVPNSFMYDPLDKAVERLWFGGVVVVAAAGNYGVSGQPSDIPFAPGNDPFVITVGANDIDGSIHTWDDEAAPWSAYGYTLDGFSKPEIGAPGRYMIGPVPATSTLPIERPGQVRGTGYIELSGTSFAAPLVAGISAYLLALHPNWTPDQVKGALMLTAKSTPSAKPGSLGVGEVNGPKAADVENPPNPNLALRQFVKTDSSGSGSGDNAPYFDAASWAHVAQENASWASASWASASWASASWASASWASASWASASWASASWASSAEAAASWASASWASASYEDGADGDPAIGGETVTPEEQAAAEAELGIADPPLLNP